MQEIAALFISSEKPQWMTALHFAVMVRLLAQTTPEQPRTWLSRNTIAKQTGMAERSVSTGIETLVQEKWINKISGKRAYNQNLYEILYANLPTQQRQKSPISEEAIALATIYCHKFVREHMTYVNKRGRRCRRRLRRDWKERWSQVIQRFLDAGNSPDFITRVFNWASENKPKAFIAGPQGLRAVWPQGVTK
jgi:hypothetical protein